MPKKRRKKNWSYNAGERGRNWVRAYQQSRDNGFYLEWMEDGRRRSTRLCDVADATEAKQHADRLAADFEAAMPRPRVVSLSGTIDRYQKEVTPHKGESKRQHDARCARIFRSFFDGQPEPSRRMSRTPDSLDRIDWDRFINARRDGKIPGFERCVADRSVEYDLKFMLAVLNWAVGARIMESSPWQAEIRASQHWLMPKEVNPNRPSMPEDLFQGLMAHAPSWQFAAMLRLGRETGRRNSAIRQLLWSDIDFANRVIRWRAETDKSGRYSEAAMLESVEEVLRRLPTRGIGDLPIFPDGTGQPTSRHTCQVWLRRAKARLLASLPEQEAAPTRKRLKRVGYHSLKRSMVRDPDFRALPPAIQAAYVGTDYRTLARIYDNVTPNDQRAAFERILSRPIVSNSSTSGGTSGTDS